MKKLANRLWMLFLSGVLFLACDREGVSLEELYLQREFVPISNVEGESYFGKVFFVWDKPDSTSLLFFNEISWTNPDGTSDRKIVHRSQDSVVVDGLGSGSYNFVITSFSDTGEKIKVGTLDFEVLDWSYEPPVLINDFVASPAENKLFLTWKHPEHATYQEAVFEVYQNGNLVDQVAVGKDEEASYIFTLDYTMEYELKYYSRGFMDIISTEQLVIPFTTGRWVPTPPEIVVNKSRIDACHSADIKWTSPGADSDSLRITYKDMLNNTSVCVFSAHDEEGWLGLLPGGANKITVEVSNIYGDWSVPATQTLTTLLNAARFQFRAGNGLANGSVLGRSIYTYMGKGTSDQYGANPGGVFFTFADLNTMDGMSSFYYLPNDCTSIDELEVMVGLKRIVLQQYTGTALTLQDFTSAIDRMPSLETVWLRAGHRYYDEIKDYMVINHPTKTLNFY